MKVLLLLAGRKSLALGSNGETRSTKEIGDTLIEVRDHLYELPATPQESNGEFSTTEENCGEFSTNRAKC